MILSLIIIIILVVLAVCLVYAIRKIINYSDNKITEIDRYRDYFLLINHWFYLKQRGIAISDYLLKNGYARIVVYGMGALGLRLCDEIIDSEIEIDRTVDLMCNTIYYEHGEVMNPEEGLKDIHADVVIVTANVDKEIIKSYMDNKDIPVIYLKEIIECM